MRQQTVDRSAKWHRFRHARTTLSGTAVDVVGRVREDAAGERREVQPASAPGGAGRTRTTKGADRANQMGIWFILSVVFIE